MAKRRRVRRAAARVARKARRVVRRRARGRSMGGSDFLPNMTMLMYSGLGGAGYTITSSLGQKYLGQGLVGQLAGAYAIWFIGEKLMRSEYPGAGAIGAVSADIARQYNLPGMLGLSDYMDAMGNPRSNRTVAPSAHVPIKLPGGRTLVLGDAADYMDTGLSARHSHSNRKFHYYQ